MRKMYMVKHGWNTSLLFEHKKDAMDVMDAFERGKPVDYDYIEGKGSMYKESITKENEVSVTIVNVYTQEEIDAARPIKEEEV